MKIAVVVCDFPAVSETFILNQITGLIDMGQDITIFALGRDNSSQLHGDIEKYNLAKKVVYIPAVPTGKTKCRLKALVLLAGFFLAKPLRAVKITGYFLSRPVQSTYPSFFFALSVLKHDFAIIHCHYGFNGNLAWHLKKISPSVKVLTTFHGYDINGYPSKAGSDVYKDLFENGDLFTANTEFTRQKVIALGGKPDKIEILPVALKIENFRFKPRALQPGRPVKLLTVARLVEKKGHIYTLKAIARLAGRHDNIIYDIVGDGPLRNLLQQAVKELGLERMVHFHGALAGSRLQQKYDDAHIFILSSVTAADGDMEGQGLVLQEAQACGLPVITTFHNGIPDGVLDGKSALLVPEKDVDSLTQKLEYLIENPHLWPQMGKIGRQFVENKYDAKILNNRLMEIYRRLAGRV